MIRRTLRVPAGVLLALTLVGPVPGAAQTVITFRVDMSPAMEAGWFDPAAEQVGVRGSTHPFSWSQTLPAADTDGDGIYELAVSLDNSPEPLKYKFKVEGTDNPNEGWESHRDWIVIRDGSTHLESRAFDAQPPALEPTYTGTVERISAVSSTWLDESRDVLVWLPPGYATGMDRYPVLYLQDGQNVFDAAAAGVEWSVDETATRLVEEGQINPVLIVGVSSTGDRMAEYTPTAMASRGGEGGRGADYGRFLTGELKPLIDARYRTLPEQASVGGSSLGGLISMYLGATYPQVFSGLLVVSPSVWWDNRQVLQTARAADLAGIRVWLDMGMAEGDQMVAGARALREVLSDGVGDPDALMYREAPGAGHNEGAWAARVADMLLFLYGTGR